MDSATKTKERAIIPTPAALYRVLTLYLYYKTATPNSMIGKTN